LDADFTGHLEQVIPLGIEELLLLLARRICLSCSLPSASWMGT
jgi:hypothetical protein